MKTPVKICLTAMLLLIVPIVDIPLLPVQLVPDAEAILGVRRRTARRTAVVAYSAGAASATAASQAAAVPQQQAAPPPPPPQEAAAPQQQPPAQQPVSTVPVGTVVQTLPGKCVPVTIGNVQYQECAGSFYRTAFQGNSLVYVVVDKPL